MTTIAYGTKTRANVEIEAAESLLREALTAQGFGVLSEIDVAATLREKLGIEVAPYRILGACNPELAARALDVEADIGLLLPCNVAIYEDGDDTVVAVLDPTTMVDLTRNPALEPIATEARTRLRRVVADLEAKKNEDADA